MTHCSRKCCLLISVNFFLLLCTMQRSQTQKNVWSLSTRPWSCCLQLTMRHCDTSWLILRGKNAQFMCTFAHVQQTATSNDQLSSLILSAVLHIQSDPLWEREPHVQRELGHRVWPNPDEGPRPGCHDSPQRHPISETCGGITHY